RRPRGARRAPARGDHRGGGAMNLRAWKPVMSPRLFATMALALLLAACGKQQAPASADDTATTPLSVFAAASLKESMDAAAEAFKQQTGQPVQVSYAGSSALARQIEQRAPADVFV